MFTSANILAVIVALFCALSIFSIFKFTSQKFTAAPTGDELAKDLIIKRNAITEGERVYGGNDRLTWLKQAKAYLEKNQRK